MTTYRIKVRDHFDEADVEFDCADDELIGDALENANLEWNYSCRAGSCSSCVLLMTSGEVDQSDQSFLSDDAIATGWVTICAAYPLSDCNFDGTKTEEEFHSRFGRSSSRY